MSKTLFNLLLISASVALYFIVISPIYFGGGYLYIVSPDQSIISLNEFKNKNDIAFQQIEEGLVKIDNLKKEYDLIDQYTQDRLNTMIPDDIDGVRLVSEVSNMITSLGLPIDNISYSKESEDKKIPEVGIYSISFSTKGSYYDLKNLISKFETSMRIFSIQSVNFSTNNLSEPMVVNVKMNTYYIK